MPSIALDKAEQRGIEKVAVNMLNNGNPFEEIQSITELSLERIRQLAEDLKAKTGRSDNNAFDCFG